MARILESHKGEPDAAGGKKEAVAEPRGWSAEPRIAAVSFALQPLTRAQGLACGDARQGRAQDVNAHGRCRDRVIVAGFLYQAQPGGIILEQMPPVSAKGKQRLASDADRRMGNEIVADE